ncbi:MAG TPA: MraY family glycosyltransferase [Acidimicrobiia bacterium]|nr:MraY family glycosyltransferase [Acidimicrobiia bacterium]
MAALIVAGVVSLAWCFFAIWLGPVFGYVDRPDDSALTAHERPAVPLGGVGVFLGVNAAGFMRSDLELGLLIATTMVLILGLIDDRRGIDPKMRLGVELVAAVVLVVNVAGDPGIVYVVLGIALAVFAINSVNLFDGLDGLVGSVGLVTAAGLAVIAQGRGLDFVSPLELGAALAGFLVLNWHPARVFMGDAGAYFLGLYLTHLIIDSTNDSALELVLTAGVLGVFAIDMLVTLLRRRLNHRPLFLGDRSHIYDQLRDRGLGVRSIVVIAATTQAILLAFVIAAERLLGVEWGLVTLSGLLALLLAGLARLGFLRVDQART